MGEGIVLGDSRGGKEARECAAQQDGDQRQGLFRATVGAGADVRAAGRGGE